MSGSSRHSTVYSEDSNDDDLEVATVLARGLGMSPRRHSQSTTEQHSSAGRHSGFSPYRASTVMTNVSRGNTATVTPLATPNFTIFHLAAQGELVALVEDLNDHDINELDEQGMTMLMWASLHDQADVVEYLLGRGAQCDNQTPDGITALMLAASNGHERVLDMLVKAKVKTNLRSKDGNTALIYAVHKQNARCVQCLLEAGADIAAMNLNGCTPIELASRLPSRNVQTVFEDYLRNLLDPP